MHSFQRSCAWKRSESFIVAFKVHECLLNKRKCNSRGQLLFTGEGCAKWPRSKLFGCHENVHSPCCFFRQSLSYGWSKQGFRDGVQVAISEVLSERA